MTTKLYQHKVDSDCPIMEVSDIYFGGVHQKTIAPQGSATKNIHIVNGYALDESRPSFVHWVQDFNEIAG